MINNKGAIDKFPAKGDRGGVTIGVPRGIVLVDGGSVSSSGSREVDLSNFLRAYLKIALSTAYLSSRGFDNSDTSRDILLTLNNIAVVLDEEGPWYIYWGLAGRKVIVVK